MIIGHLRRGLLPATAALFDPDSAISLTVAKSADPPISDLIRLDLARFFLLFNDLD